MNLRIRKQLNVDKISQVTLGVIFLLSGLLKIIDLPVFLESLQSMYFIPSNAIGIVALSVIFVEILIGFLISTNILSKISIIVAIGLISLFELISIYSVITNQNWICACFGSFFVGNFSFSTIFRDAFILALAILVYYRRSLNNFNDNKIYQVGIAITILCSLLLLLSFWTKQQDLPNKLVVGDKIEESQMYTIDNQLIDTYLNRNSQLLLLIFFDLEHDCTSCLTEFSLWKKIHENYTTGIFLLGIAYAKNNDFLEKWISARELKFPIIYDKEKNIMNQFGVVYTPVKILINREYEIIALQKSSSNEKSHENFYRTIEQYLN